MIEGNIGRTARHGPAARDEAAAVTSDAADVEGTGAEDEDIAALPEEEETETEDATVLAEEEAEDEDVMVLSEEGPEEENVPTVPYVDETTETKRFTVEILRNNVSKFQGQSPMPTLTYTVTYYDADGVQQDYEEAGTVTVSRFGKVGFEGYIYPHKWQFPEGWEDSQKNAYTMKIAITQSGLEVYGFTLKFQGSNTYPVLSTPPAETNGNTAIFTVPGASACYKITMSTFYDTEADVEYVPTWTLRTSATFFNAGTLSWTFKENYYIDYYFDGVYAGSLGKDSDSLSGDDWIIEIPYKGVTVTFVEHNADIRGLTMTGNKTRGEDGTWSFDVVFEDNTAYLPGTTEDGVTRGGIAGCLMILNYYVNANAPITVEKFADKATVQTGDTVTYTVKVTNVSKDEQTVSFRDILPQGMTLVGEIPEAFTLPAGESRTITYQAKVDASLGENEDSRALVNTATAIADEWTVEGGAVVTLTKADSGIVVVPPEEHTHNYTSEVTKQPNCTEKGEKTFTCTDTECGDSYTETIDELGHAYPDEWTVKTPATCEGDGVKEKVCANDSDHVLTDTIPATG